MKRYIPRCSEAIYGAYGGANSPNCLTATHLAQAEAARKRHLYIGRSAMEEHRISNPAVAGSNPAGGTIC